MTTISRSDIVTGKIHPVRRLAKRAVSSGDPVGRHVSREVGWLVILG